MWRGEEGWLGLVVDSWSHVSRGVNPPSIHPSIHPLPHSFTHPLPHSFTHPPTPPLLHSPTHLLTHSPTHSSTPSLLHSFTPSPTHPPTHPPTPPLLRSPTHLLTHHSFTHSPVEGRDGGSPSRAAATVALRRHHDPRRFPRTATAATAATTGGDVGVPVDGLFRLYVDVFLVAVEGADRRPLAHVHETHHPALRGTHLEDSQAKTRQDRTS